MQRENAHRKIYPADKASNGEGLGLDFALALSFRGRLPEQRETKHNAMASISRALLVISRLGCLDDSEVLPLQERIACKVNAVDFDALAPNLGMFRSGSLNYEQYLRELKAMGREAIFAALSDSFKELADLTVHNMQRVSVRKYTSEYMMERVGSVITEVLKSLNGSRSAGPATLPGCYGHGRRR